MWQWKLIAFVKVLASFFKRAWTLHDYPLRISQQEEINLPTNGSWLPGAWHAQIVNWEQMAAYGSTREEALAHLTKNFNAYHRRHGAVPRPGTNVPNELVPTTEIDQYIGIGRDFCEKILEVNFARAFVSDESSLWDFLDRSDEADVFERIQHTYQVDVSDIQSGNLAQIFKRIHQHAATEPAKYPAAFFKSEWTLKDYLLRIRHQDENIPAIGSLKPVAWHVQIVGWWHMAGYGDTRAEALANLAEHFKDYTGTHGAAPRPGTPVPIDSAPTTEIDKYEFIARDFLGKILEVDYDRTFISNDSSLWDFLIVFPSTLDEVNVFEHIKQTYQVDVSDIESGNLVQIFKRIQEHIAEMENNKAIYRRLIDGLRLVASPYQVQCEVLPDFVHVPDEILNAVEYIYIPQLLRAGIISEEQAKAFKEFDDYLGTLEPEEDYEVVLRNVESGDWFNELRQRALALLKLLGEAYQRPTLEGISYMRGA